MSESSRVDRERQAGYAAWGAGKPFSKSRSLWWRDGWCVGADSKWREDLAAKMGCRVSGFSYRSSATIVWSGGGAQSLEGGLLNLVCRLLDHDPMKDATTPKPEAAQDMQGRKG